MLTVVLALLALGAIGLVFGKAPLFRATFSLLALLLFALTSVSWFALAFGLLDLGRAVNRWSGSAPALAAVALVPPVVLTLWVLLLLRRRGRPRFLWARAHRPATLSLRTIVALQMAAAGAWIVGGSLLASSRERATEGAWLATETGRSSRGLRAKRETNPAGQLTEPLRLHSGDPG
jgi:hypothetical protein